MSPVRIFGMGDAVDYLSNMAKIPAYLGSLGIDMANMWTDACMKAYETNAEVVRSAFRMPDDVKIKRMVREIVERAS
jgi:hypothetical protein